MVLGPDEAVELVYEPPLPNLALRPVLDERGQVVQRAERISDLISHNELGALNRARLGALGINIDQVLDSDPNYRVTAYMAEGGSVVELRDIHNPVDHGWTAAVSRRAREELFYGARTTHVRITDLLGADSDEIHDRVAGLEKDGIVVSAQIEGNAHGVYMGDGVNKDGTLKGAHLDGVRPVAVRVTDIEEIVSSEEPRTPELGKNGLRRISVHGMGLARFSEGQWAPSHVLPSGAVGMDIFDNTALQYAQEAFEGMLCVFNGEDFDIYGMEANEERFVHSCEVMGIPPLPKGQFTATIREVLKANERYVKAMKSGDKFYIRPCAIGTRGGAGANAATEYLFSVEVTPFALYLADPSQGVAMEGRLDIHRPSTATVKAGANYGPNFEEKAEVKKRKASGGANYADYISFDEDGELEEVSAAAFFGVERKEEDGRVTYRLVTPVTKREDETIGKHILPSTVRQLVLDLVQEIATDDELMAEMVAEIARILTERGTAQDVPEFNLDFAVENIPHGNLRNMVAAFATGTAAGVTRIGLLDVKTGPEDTNPEVCDYDQDSVAIALIRYLYDLVMKARVGGFTGKLASFNEKVTRVPINPSLLSAAA